LLDKLSILSLKFERDELMISEVMLEVEKTVSHLEELEDEDEPSVKLMESEAQVKMAGATLSATRTKAGHQKKKEKESVAINYEGMKQEAAIDQEAIKKKAIPSIISCLQDRFSSFSNPVSDSLGWLDPANWQPNDRAAEVPELEKFSNHFIQPLQLAGFDKHKIKREWKDRRLTVSKYYQKHKALPLWEALMKYRRSEFSNVLLLVEFALCMGVSNSVIESGFSRLTLLLSDRRLSMAHSTMEAFVLISINDKIWTEQEREDIMQAAVEDYTMQSRRKRKMEPEPEAKKPRLDDNQLQKKQVSDHSDSEPESD
jgi:hypothetical protein